MAQRIGITRPAGPSRAAAPAQRASSVAAFDGRTLRPSTRRPNHFAQDNRDDLDPGSAVHERRVSAEFLQHPPGAAETLAQAHKFGAAFGIPDFPRQVRAQARALAGGTPHELRLSGRRAQSVARLLGLQLALAGLEDEADERHAAACLTPLPHRDESFESLRLWLVEHLDDDEEFAEAARAVLSDRRGDEKQDEEQRHDFRRHAKRQAYDAPALARLLLEVQGLPDSAAMRARRDALLHEWREYALSGDGRLADATLDGLERLPGAGEAAQDPEKFLAALDGVERAQGFAATLQAILDSYGFDDLALALAARRQEHVEHLEAAGRNNESRLGAALAALCDTQVVATFMELVTEATEFLNRELARGGEAVTVSVNGEAFLRGLLRIIAAATSPDGGEAGVAQGRFRQLAEALKLPEGRPMAVFFNRLRPLMQDLSDRAYIDAPRRIALVNALDRAIDDAADDEERLLDEAVA